MNTITTKNSTEILYPGLARGMRTTHGGLINRDLLAFAKRKAIAVAGPRHWEIA